MSLRLKVTDWVDVTRWRWLLEEQDGRFVADHTVRLDPASREYQGFCDLDRYVDYHAPVITPREQLRRLGVWIGEQVFGELRTVLRERARLPGEALQVLVPEAAQSLIERPFEIACFADGKRFDAVGLRLTYQSEAAVTADKSGGADLRLLAVFSLPVRANPLNLRRERYQLQQLVRRLQQTQGLAVELRVLQYGATRQTLRETLEEADGWDVVHLSGHGQRGELMLENDDGGEDPIDTLSLGDLLEPARDRLKLLLLDACYSGAASHAAARVQVGLDTVRDPGTAPPAASTIATQATPLPSLGYTLAEQLDCAVLAMRYPVGDGFATELMLALYEKLLNKHPLPAALQLALRVALKEELAPSVLAELTPVLLGARAGALKLAALIHAAPITLPPTGLGIGFPPQPPRFVGRMQPMLHASQSLAPHSPRRAVLFHGMPGAGKSACALELAYRHEQGRFMGHIWYQAPEAGSDIASALFNLMHEIQRQLNAPELGLTTALDDPKRFVQFTLPRLRTLLEQYAILLVLDNLETLLTESDQWRIPLWGEVLQTLLTHQGLSRVVLTSRRVPAPLAHDARVQIEPIHALSFAESVLLARELPRLRTLFVAEADHALLRQTLRVVQGHPKLMELADGLAADRAALQERVSAAETQLVSSGELLDAFFAKGGAHEGESRQPPEQFVQALQGWTGDVLARLTPTAQRLFYFLCRLEPDDREHAVVQANWDDTLARLGEADAAAVSARAEPGQGVDPALQALQDAGLVDVTRPGPEAPDSTRARYGIHPGVAEAALAGADPTLLRATDMELGNFFLTLVSRGLKTEAEGGGVMVTHAARRGVPYLMRTQRWREAANLLEKLLQRDNSPDTVAFALPLLERIAVASVGDEQLELQAIGILAQALAQAGRRVEAERRMREVIDRARASGQHWVASATGGYLTTLLGNAGRSDEAQQVVEAKAEDTRKAGLGPWTQLSDEVQRLQLLNALGRYDEVREEVERLRLQMAALADTGEAAEAADAWSVREGLLDTGHTAALYSDRFEDALVLNGEILQSMRARGAGALEMARTCFNDSGPLLRLKRLPDARALLLECRGVFEAERDRQGMGMVFSALADLEDETGASDKAADFQSLALDYDYQVGDPDECASSHHNLANYLMWSAGNPAQALAHRLAAAVLCVQIRSGQLPLTLRALASLDLAPLPPAFADVVQEVEAVPGVRLAALFERLPRTLADGDAALAEIWRMVHEEKAQGDQQAQSKNAVLAAMPPAIQAAFELDGEAFSQALQSALQALPGDEAAQALHRLREAGLIGSGGTEGDHSARLFEQFEPLLQAMAAVARGDDQSRASIETLLTDLDGKGFKLAEPVRRIWDGERNELDLVTGLDSVCARLVARVLEILSPSKGE